MTPEDISRLYNKERRYQKKMFGSYKSNECLNTASILTFLRAYIVRADKSYTENWTDSLPPWLLRCKESDVQQSAPVMTYDALVKIMTLAGAALESYTDIDVSLWRPELGSE